MAYIANRPVRFDRDYAIGEVIPESVIDPKMTKRLVDMGKIICADIPAGSGAGDEPTTEESPADGAEKPVEGGEADGQENEQATEENAAEGESDGEERPADGTEEFKCEECGKTFKSANALAAHSKCHKK